MSNSPGVSFAWPARKNPSHFDRLKLERQELAHNYGVEGQVVIFWSWDEVLERRPVDVPLYTAPQGSAVIVVLVSSQSIEHLETLEALRESRRPLKLHVRAFTQARYPILRMNLCVPDNPRNPLWLESPLDLKDGDAQDFITAAIRDERVELVMAHEAAPSQVVAIGLEAPKIGALLTQEVGSVIRAMPESPTPSDFGATSDAMRRAFPNGAAGIDPRYTVLMPFGVQTAPEETV